LDLVWPSPRLSIRVSYVPHFQASPSPETETVIAGLGALLTSYLFLHTHSNFWITKSCPCPTTYSLNPWLAFKFVFYFQNLCWSKPNLLYSQHLTNVLIVLFHLAVGRSTGTVYLLIHLRYIPDQPSLPHHPLKLPGKSAMVRKKQKWVPHTLALSYMESQGWLLALWDCVCGQESGSLSHCGANYLLTE
jgi:hypothetical protein